MACSRIQLWIAFSLLISTHEILCMCGSTVLKFYNSDWFISLLIHFHNVRVLLFQKRLNSSSLIANKVKTNMCLVAIKLFIVRNNLCATVQAWTTYTTIITTTTTRSLFLCQNYSLFCSQPFCKQQLFVFLYSEVLQTTQLHTRLTELLLTRCLALLYVLKVEGERSRALAFSKTISRCLFL